MKCLLQPLALVALVLGGSTAQAQDTAARLRAAADAVNAADATGASEDEMIVEGCIVGASLAYVPGTVRVTVRNALRTEGLVIEYIRSWNINTSARDERFLLQGGVPIVEGSTTLVQEALVDERWTKGERVASVLRPGESCQMWLPAGKVWQIVASAVPITGAGHRVVAQDQCLRVDTWQTVACSIRLDTMGYGIPGMWSGRRASVDGQRFDFDSAADWQLWKKASP